MTSTTTRRRGIALAAAALAATLGGCAAQGASATGDNAAKGERVDGGTIVYAHDQEPPCIWGGWIQQAYISRQVLDSLVSQTEGGEIVPWLATDWEVSEDQLTWTFTLKEGVTFTDGTPLDAAAVVRNFDYWLKENGNGTVAAYLADYYAGSRAVDATTFELSLTKPYSPLLSALSQAYFGIQSPTALARGPEANCEEPIGTGPFTVEEWKRGESVTLLRNPNYSSAPENAKHDGPAYVDGVEWRFVHDPVARFGSLTTGESNVIYDIPTTQWKAAESQFQVQQYITPGRPVALWLDTVEGPFTDLKVRQAFAHATDRENAVKTAFNGVIPFEGNGTVSQSTPGYNADAADDYPFDPEKAAELLDEAGWTEKDAEGYRTKDGQPLEVTLVYGAGAYITSEGATVLQNIQEQAKQSGFKVTLVPASQDEYRSGKFSTPETFDAKPSYWTSPTSGILYITYRQNLPEKPNPTNQSFYNNPDVERLILEANSTLDPEKQAELYGEAQQILSDEAVSIGLYTQTTSLAVAPHLHDVWLEDSQGEPVFHDAYFVE